MHRTKLEGVNRKAHPIAADISLLASQAGQAGGFEGPNMKSPQSVRLVHILA